MHPSPLNDKESSVYSLSLVFTSQNVELLPCLRLTSAAKLTAASSAERNDIVLRSLPLFLSTSFCCLPLSLPPSPSPSPYSSVRACWLFKLHSSAVFPYCRSSSCMSECAVTFKGERNLEGQRAPQLPPTATIVTLHPLGCISWTRRSSKRRGG